MTAKIIGPEMLTPAEVAALFGVDPKTVIRWAKAGKLTSIRTLGGHRRFRRDEIEALLNGGGQSWVCGRCQAAFTGPKPDSGICPGCAAWDQAPGREQAGAS